MNRYIYSFLIFSALLGLFSNSSISAQTPYGGKARTIPGVIQVEDFDEGGEGVAYHDQDAVNDGGGYRLNEGIDIHSTIFDPFDESYIIGWFRNQEWMAYTVDVKAGTYNLTLRLGTPNNGTVLEIYLDDSLLLRYDVPNTGSWDMTDMTVRNLEIPRGGEGRILKLKNPAAKGLEDIDFNFSALSFDTISTVATNYNFTHSFISKNLPTGGGTAIQTLADYDNDGDLDMTVGSTSDGLFLFRNTGSGWEGSKIGTVFYQSLGASALDVNQDGWMDVVSAGVWYENNEAVSFIPHQYDAEFVVGNEFHDIVVADLNNDGAKDVVGMGDQTGFFWYNIAPDPSLSWTRVTIDPNYLNDHVHGGFSPEGIGDLDGDGDNDIFRANAWYENKDDGATWIKHDIVFPEMFVGPLPYGKSTRSVVIDIDNDGDNDIVFSESDKIYGKAGIIENTKGNGSEWKLNLLPQTAPGKRCSLHSLRVADFNMDGKLDVFTADQEDMMESGIPSPRWYMFTQVNGNWEEQVLFDIGLGGHDILAGDVDQDGDIDITSKEWNSWTGSALKGIPHADYLENHQIDQESEGIRLSTDVVNDWNKTGGRWREMGDYIIGDQDLNTTKRGGLLLTKEKYGDCEVVFDVWPDYGIDTGIYLRATGDEEAYQVTIDYQEDNPMGGIYPTNIAGNTKWDFTIKNASQINGAPGLFDKNAWSYIWKENDWNQFRVRITGNPPSITTWINGWKVNEYKDTEIRLANDGSIGFQVHDGDDWAEGKVVRYRNIKVYPLNITTVQDPVQKKKIKHYPVPVQNTMKVDELPESCLISVFDVMGHLVLSANNGQNNDMQLDMSNLKTGFYFFRVTSGSNLIDDFKVIKE